MTVIGVLTGGGDTTALNATIYGIVSAARKRSWKIYGIEKGFEGLIGKTADINDYKGVRIVNLTDIDLEGIQFTGGSILKCSRLNPDTSERIKKCQQVMERYGINHLVIIGGDDTNTAATALYKNGISVNTVNKTMDNDIKGTLFCLGYPSAVYRATDYAGGLHSTLKTNDRDAVLYVFGRKAGWAPLATASWLDPEDPCRYPHIVFVPEMGEISEDKILELYDKAKKEHGYVELAVSEGTRIKGIEHKTDELIKKYPEIVDQYGNVDLKALDTPGYIAELIRNHRGLTGKNRESQVIYRNLDYYLRCGQPTPIDRELAIAAGRHAVELLANSVLGRMVNVTEGKVIEGYGVGDISLENVSGNRTLEEKMFDPNTCTPTKDFIEYVRKFIPDPRAFRLHNKTLPQASERSIERALARTSREEERAR